MLAHYVKGVNPKGIESGGDNCGETHWKAAKSKSKLFKHLEERLKRVKTI